MADLKSLSFITENKPLPLITKDEPDKRFKIHDLVNWWAQAQLEDADLQGIAEHAASIVTSSLILDSDTRTSSEWKYERKIMSQIDHCYNIFQTRLASKDMDDQTRSIACKLAKVYGYHSNAEKPEVLYKWSLRDAKEGSETLEELRMMNYLGANLTFKADRHGGGPLYWHKRARSGMKKLGLDDSDADVVETKKYMANFFTRNGEPSKAIKEYNEILLVQEAKLGEDNPQTLETRYSLADALTGHGQIEEALRHSEKVQSAREADPKLGKDHPKTLEARYLVADILDRKGEYEEALKVCKEMLEIQEKGLGKNHYSTIKTIHRIGDIYRKKQEYPKALHYFKMALEGLEEIFGAGNSHDRTLLVRVGIADLSDLEGDYHEALRGYEMLHAKYKSTYGAGGKVTIWELRAALDIGRVLGRMGNYKKSLQFLEETAQTLKEKEEAGELKNHFLTPSSILRIGNAQENQGQYDEAMKSYKWVEERCRSVRGEGHITTLVAVRSIAGVLNKQGKYADALAQYNKAEEGLQKAVGDAHPETFEAMLGKAEVHQNMGHFKESSDLYRKVFYKLKEMEPEQDKGVARKYGHPMMLMATYGMGRALEGEKEYEKAFQYYDLAREGWERSLNKGHTLALTAELGSGRMLQKQGKYRDARAIYDRIWLDMTKNDDTLKNEQPLRMDHPLRYEAACSKGSVLLKMHKYDEAKASYEEALGGLGRILGDHHPATLEAMQGKANILEREKDYRGALELYRTVAAGLHDTLGDQHPETTRIRKKVLSVQRRKKFGRWLCFSL